MLLNNQEITEEIKEEIRKYIEKKKKRKEKKSTMTQNLWDTAKAILRGKFISRKLVSGNKEISNKLN